jgi:hypothetical protein
MATIIFKLLKEYEIAEKFFCITTDNASNNTTMVQYLSKLLSAEGITWSHQANHIRCMAHIINLAVQEFLEAMDSDHEVDLAGSFPPNSKVNFKALLILLVHWQNSSAPAH